MTTTSHQDEVTRREWEQHRADDLAAAEKPKANVIVEERERERSISDASSTSPKVHWQPGVTARFPWLGFGALLTILGCIALTVTILVTSNNKAAEEWPAYQKWHWINDKWKKRTQLSPSTALAVVNTVSNLALAIAVGQGVAIAWWRKAVKGATVVDLHNSWSYSTSVLDLLTAGTNFNLIALAALAAKLALVDNVLLQRAAGSEPGVFQQSITNLRLPIVAELPAGYAGTFSTDGITGYLSQAFSTNVYYYQTNAGSITFDELSAGLLSEAFDTHCRGTCTAIVQGFGFNVTCSGDVIGQSYNVTSKTSGSNIFNASNPSSTSSFDATESTSLRTLLDVYSSALQPDVELTNGNNTVSHPYPWISLVSSYAAIEPTLMYPSDGSEATSDQTKCTGDLITNTCEIRPAVINYPIQITNYSSSAAHTKPSIQLTTNPNYNFVSQSTAGGKGDLETGQIGGMEVVRSAYTTNPSDYTSNIQAIGNVFQNFFGTTVTLEYLNNTGFIAHAETGSLGQWWTTYGSASYLPGSCAITVGDPTIWLIQQLNSIMIRASISAAVDQSANTHINSSIVSGINGTQTVDTIIYTSNYGYMGGAVAVMFLCILCVLPAYYGFWQLGRKVTLGPLEIASAFQAPVLDNPAVASGGEVNMLLREVGSRQVRYGEVQGTGRLAMAEPGVVRRLTEPPHTNGWSSSNRGSA